MTTQEMIVFGLRAIMDHSDFEIKITDNYLECYTDSCDKKATIEGIPAFDYYEEVTQLGIHSIKTGEFDHIIYEGKKPTAEQKKKELEKEWKNNSYDSGVHKKIRKFLDEHGWICEWNDPETVHIYNPKGKSK